MTIRDWPAQERPREKLIARGAAALSDAELLAIFIGTGRRGHSAVDIGRELVSRHGTLRCLLDGSLQDLAAHEGLGVAKAARLHAALEIGRRYLACELEERATLQHPLECAEFIRSRILAYPYEVFACLFLDTRNRIIVFEELFRGTIDGAEVHVREVVRRCIAHNAAAVIFAHNHPSGVVDASASDRGITKTLQSAMHLIGVRVLDHIIVAGGRCLSFAQCGYL